jgi:DNA-binding MarR family transcriptional regulator
VARRPERGISLLFDLFVLNQHVRRLLATALAEAPLRGDEYAVYSLVFEQGPLTATEMSRRTGMPLSTVLDYLRTMEARGHLRRERHPRDGRAQNLALTLEGVAEQRRTNAHWEAMRIRLEAALPLSRDEVGRALNALDDAAVAALAELEQGSAAG